MASAAKKLKMSPGVEDKPECPYGTKCYRKNPEHLKEFLHPTKDGISNGSQSKPDASAASLPPCKYGANCYRKNLMHFAEFSHPTQPTSGADSGSDTDVCESDEESKGNTTLTKGDTLMLVKSYTKMSDSERKELIQRAIAVKKQLQDELKQTREKVAEKDRELKALQDKVTTGLLLVDGEKEALEGNETKYFSLQAERAYREGSADQIHFRLAESQFYRLLSGQYSQSYRVTKVEYLVNPKLVKNFSQAREDLKKERGENLSLPVLAFHGTDQSVIPKICEGGFLVPGGKGFKHKTDTGWYGKGVYFSEYPAYSMGYIQGATNLLLCQVLPGKVYQCTKLIHGASLQSGYDSHTSPDKKELVVFNSHHILPSYIVHYTNATTEFKYSSKAAQSEAELKAKYEKACKCPVKKGKSVFAGVEFTISGAMVVSQKELLALIAKHGGKAGTAKRFDLLIATENEINSGTSKVLKAREKGANTILCQDYIYDMIISKGSIKDRADYEL